MNACVSRLSALISALLPLKPFSHLCHELVPPSDVQIFVQHLTRWRRRHHVQRLLETCSPRQEEKEKKTRSKCEENKTKIYNDTVTLLPRDGYSVWDVIQGSDGDVQNVTPGTLTASKNSAPLYITATSVIISATDYVPPPSGHGIPLRSKYFSPSGLVYMCCSSGASKIPRLMWDRHLAWLKSDSNVIKICGAENQENTREEEKMTTCQHNTPSPRNTSPSRCIPPLQDAYTPFPLAYPCGSLLKRT